MRDNGDDVFGEPLDRVDRHAPSRISSSLSSTMLSSHTSSSTLASSPTILISSSSTSSTSPLDAFIQSVHRALNSGLSPETLVANIHLIVQERVDAPNSLPTIHDEFFSQ